MKIKVRKIITSVMLMAILIMTGCSFNNGDTIEKYREGTEIETVL